uniref:Uncharacterized protein n=1 Tax=Oryza brachyantha TaxID=4533 RepID=J3MKH3_ORYBR
MAVMLDSEEEDAPEDERNGVALDDGAPEIEEEDDTLACECFGSVHAVDDRKAYYNAHRLAQQKSCSRCVYFTWTARPFYYLSTFSKCSMICIHRNKLQRKMANKISKASELERAQEIAEMLEMKKKISTVAADDEYFEIHPDSILIPELEQKFDDEICNDYWGC